MFSSKLDNNFIVKYVNKIIKITINCGGIFDEINRIFQCTCYMK
jgi:hypothetical protein